MYNYQVTFIDDDGETVVRTVLARNTFEAVQLAGAFNKTILSIVNTDL